MTGMAASAKFLGLAIIAIVVIATQVVASNDFPRACTGDYAHFKFCDTSLSFETRTSALVALLTPEEKSNQMGNNAHSIPRLGIPAYQYWSEALHGVNSHCDKATGKCATSFPNGMGVAATFNTDLFERMGVAISTEARAQRSASDQNPEGGIIGLDVWTPNINIFRDPRWGRGQETPGEDPYLTSQYAVHLIKALQGELDENSGPYLKLAATMKHFAGYSLENWHGMDRHHFDANISQHDLEQTYYPAFKAAVQQANVYGCMCSYNSVNGIPSCAHPFLQDTLRGEWGFSGYVTSDCGAIEDIYKTHNYTADQWTATGIAIKAGTDTDCGTVYNNSLITALEKGYVSMDDVDTALYRLFLMRMKLGMFDPLDGQPYAHYSIDVVDCPPHRGLASLIARESIVLLKNDPVNGEPILPLKAPTTAAVIGPNAKAYSTLCSNYHGSLPHVVSPLEGLQQVDGLKINYAYGCGITGDDTSGFAEAINAAKTSDVALVFLGLNQTVEKEGLDREQISLPGVQLQMLQEIFKVNPRTVVILINGGPVAIDWAAEYIPAIVEAFYPGEEGGSAIRDVLFGKYNPSGRMPVMVYPSNYVNEISMETMDMKAGPGRTYRFYNKNDALFPFAFGLSYSSFYFHGHIIFPPTRLAALPQTSNTLSTSAQLSDTRGEPEMTYVFATDKVIWNVTVKNTGAVAGDVSAPTFIQHEPFNPDCPKYQLFDFFKVQNLLPGATHYGTWLLTPEKQYCVDSEGRSYVQHGTKIISTGLRVEDVVSRFVIVGSKGETEGRTYL